MWPFSFPMESGKGRWVVVTGCDQGLGLLICRELLSHGFHVIAACLTAQGAASCGDLGQEGGGRVVGVRADVTCARDVAAVADRAASLVGGEPGLWALVNNAGVNRPGPSDLQGMDDFRLVLEVNLFGHVAMTKALMPLLKRAKGRVVNITSAAGLTPLAGSSAYTASKHAMEGFTGSIRQVPRQARQELKPWGVSVTAVEPGFVRTGLIDPGTMHRELEATWAKAPADVKVEYTAMWGEEYPRRVADLSHREIEKIVEGPETVSRAVSDLLRMAGEPPARRRVGAMHVLFRVIECGPLWLRELILQATDIVPKLSRLDQAPRRGWMW